MENGEEIQDHRLRGTRITSQICIHTYSLKNTQLKKIKKIYVFIVVEPLRPDYPLPRVHLSFKKIFLVVQGVLPTPPPL